MSTITQAVFNCNLFLQALAVPEGPAGRCVQLAFDADVRLFVSATVLQELIEVADRPRVASKLRLSPERVAAFVEAIERAAVLLQDIPETFIYDRDPDDAHYVNLALAAGAEYIVTRDKDLLDLMDQSNPSGKEFGTRFPRLCILEPVEFLRICDQQCQRAE